MADLNTTYESLLEELSVIRDERAMHTNTATRVGTAMIHMLQFSKASFDSLVDAIGELDFDTYWEEYTDPQTGNVSVKLKSQYAGAWTEGLLSALGYSPGGGGGGVTLNEPLESINNSGLSTPGTNQNEKTIVWNNTTGKWEYGTAGGGTDLNAVWDSLKAEDGSKQIDLSHLTTALAGYATQSWVTSQGYLTSLPSHNHDDRYKFGTIGVGTVQITLGGTTRSVLTSHQSLADYVKTIQLGTNGTVYSPTSGKVTLPAYPTTLPASDVYSWAKAANKPSYSFSEINNPPTTLAGYGIADAKIINGVITLGSNSITPVTSLSGYATESWVTDNMMKKARLDTTANIDTLYDAGSYRFAETAQGTWPTGVTANYGQMLVVRGADDTVAQVFFPYGDTQAYLRVGNPMKANNGSWKGWKRLVTPDMNVASATRLANNDTKTLFGNTYWSSGQPQNVGTSWSNTANLNYVNGITMKGGLNGVTAIEMNSNQNGYLQDYGGVIDFHYNASTDDYTSRIIEDKNGRLNFNGTAFIYKSNKPGKDDDFPGGALNATTDWGNYSFRNVFTNNSLFENTLFLRTDLYMKTNTGIRIKNYAGADVTALSLESNSSNNSIVVGAGAHTIAGVSTYIRGNTVNFQTANGAGSKQVGHFDNEGNFIIDVAGKSLYMSDGTTTRAMMGINISATYFHLCYGATSANWQTRIYGGGGDDKGIAFYQGTTLAAGILGGDHSLLAFYHIKLTTNNQSLYTRNTNNTAIDTVRMGNNNILNFGYGCGTNNHETRIYGGATAGVGFFCGSTEVARVHKDADRQGIRIGDALLSWDSKNNALMVQRYNGAAVNFYTFGGLSGLGFTAPQSSLDAFHIDYLTSTDIQTTTMGISDRLSLGSSNCYIQGSSAGRVTINAPSGLTLGSSNIIADPTGGLRASRFYLDSTRYIYLDGTTLKYYNGSQSKTIVLS